MFKWCRVDHCSMVPHWPTSLIVSPGVRHSFQGTVDGRSPAPVNFQSLFTVFHIGIVSKWCRISIIHRGPCVSFFFVVLVLTFWKKTHSFSATKFGSLLGYPNRAVLFEVHYDEPMYLGPYLHSNSQDDFQETLCKLLESPSAPRVRSNLSRHLWNHGNWGNYPLNSHVSGQWMIIIHPESMGVLLFLSSLLFPVSLLPVSHGVYHITCSSRS